MGKGGPPEMPDFSGTEKQEKQDVDPVAAALGIGSGPPPILPVNPGKSDPLSQIAEGCFSFAQNCPNDTMKQAVNDAGSTFSDPNSSPEMLNDTANKLGGTLDGLGGMMDHINNLSEPITNTVDNVANGVEQNPVTDMAVGAVSGTVGLETKDLTGMAKGAGSIANGASKLASGILEKDGSTKEGFNTLADGAKSFGPAASKLAGKVSGLAAGWAAGAIANVGCTAVGGVIGSVVPGAGTAAGGVIGAVASTVVTGAASSIATSVVDSTVSGVGEMAINAGADVGAKVAGEGTDALKGGVVSAAGSIMDQEDKKVGTPQKNVEGASPPSSNAPNPLDAVGDIFGAEQSVNDTPEHSADIDPMAMVTDVASNLTDGKGGGSPLDMVSGLVGGIAEKITTIAPDITEAAKLK